MTGFDASAYRGRRLAGGDTEDLLKESRGHPFGRNWL